MYIYILKYKHNASLICCPQTAKAKTKNVNKVESKRQKEIRANKTFSFIENEITAKYVQMKFIFGEQIYLKTYALWDSKSRIYFGSL